MATRRPRKQPAAATAPATPTTGSLRLDHSLGTPSNFGLSAITSWIREGSLTLDPPFQRAAVWSEAQREAWICSMLDGLPLPAVFINQSRWTKADGDFPDGQMLVIDGRQRLEAIIAFEDDRLAVRGELFSAQTEKFHRNWLFTAIPTIFTRYETMLECVALYLRLLTTGTAHTPDEIEKARAYRQTLV